MTAWRSCSGFRAVGSGRVCPEPRPLSPERRLILLSALIVFTAVIGSVSGVFPIEAAGAVQVGVAYEPLVLPAHVPLAGYSRRRGRPSTGVHDPIGARALVIQAEQTVAALVSCDLLIIDEDLFHAIRRRVLAEGLPPQLVLVVTATHTHSGPGAYGHRFLEKISMGHFDQRVFDALVEGMARAVVRAYAARQPASAAYLAAPTTELVTNRATANGLVANELVVSAFYRAQATAPFAVLVNFAAHPTTLGAWNMELSADYPGVIMREVERRLPGARCLFFAGAVGDQAPMKAGDGFEGAEREGQPLAEQVLAMLKEAQPEPLGTVIALQERLILPPAQVRLGPHVTLPRWIGRQLVDDDATLSLLRVGRTVYVGTPCDLTADLGESLKRAARARGLQPVVISFASDYIGYCVSEPFYRSGRYEALMAFNGPRTGSLIVEQFIHMLDAAGRDRK